MHSLPFNHILRYMKVLKSPPPSALFAPSALCTQISFGFGKKLDASNNLHQNLIEKVGRIISGQKR